jgi:hypothetical protein
MEPDFTGVMPQNAFGGNHLGFSARRGLAKRKLRVGLPVQCKVANSW